MHARKAYTHYRTLVLTNLAITAVFTLLLARNVNSQTPDPALNALVKKGFLTQQEAKDAWSDATKTNGTTSASKIDLAPWIQKLKFTGDFRGRFEENNSENRAYTERDRFRYRVRVAAIITLLENFDVGLRLASGNPQTTSGGTLVGGQPITANTDFSSLESRKFIWVDAAYAKWTAITNDATTFTAIIGKMDNPFRLSNMVWDYDINPEGGALVFTHKVTDKHTFTAVGAYYVLDEINQGVGSVPSIDAKDDPYVYGGQMLLDSKWCDHFETSLGVAIFDIANKNSLSTQVQPFYNSGNTRNGKTGQLIYNYNPVIGTASATYKLDCMPLYHGPFPIGLVGEYMDNPAAPKNNEAFRAGLLLGRAGKKGNWEIGYRYQRLEADSWFDALVDDDNGAFYAPGNPQMTGTGKSSGWFGGTNVKGHLVQATYSFTDFLNFTFTYYLNDLIIKNPNSTSDSGHFMADLMWRF
jgi:hypothetical protein